MFARIITKLRRAKGFIAPMADEQEASVGEAAQEFINACVDARKAWYRTNLLAIAKPLVLSSVREALKNRDGKEITALLLDIMGPVAPVELKDAMSASTISHREMAGLVCTLAMSIEVAKRGPDESVDLIAVKAMLVNWISCGAFFLDTPENKESRQARRMASIFSDLEQPSRVRLSVLAPLAPALESMIVVSELGRGMVSVLEQTAEKVARTKHKIDQTMAVN
jgi:hypothetical protein